MEKGHHNPQRSGAAVRSGPEVLHARLRDLEDECEQLRVALEDALLQVEERAEEAANHRREAEDAARRVDELRRRLAEADDRAKHAETEASSLKNARQERAALEEEYEATAEELQAANEELRLANQDLEEHRADLERRVEERTAELHSSEARQRAIVEAAHDAIIITDEAGIVQSANSAAQEMFGYGSDDLGEKSIGLLMTPVDRLRLEGYVRRYLETGERRIVGRNRLVMAQRKDGSAFPVELAVAVAKSGDEFLVVWSLRDGSPDGEQAGHPSVLRANLADAARFSAMGGLSRALAHELAQPLFAIRCYLKAGRRLLKGVEDELPSEALVNLDRAKEEFDRIDRIIHDLRDMFEIGEADRTIEDTNELVQEGLALALVGGRRSAVVRTHFLPDLPPVRVNRTQAEQVVVNLVRNALDAIGARDGGLISIFTARDGGDFVKVTVADNGPGLAPEVSSRLFFPLVSTKRNGTGIGLLISKSIIESHGGTIEGGNRADGGAVFAFTLPTVPETLSQSDGEA